MTGDFVEIISVGTLALSGFLFLWKAKLIGDLTYRLQSSSWMRVFRVPYPARFYEHAFRIIGAMFLVSVVLHLM